MKLDFKDRLKIAMNQNDIKAAELCRMINMPKSAMSFYLSGRSIPKQDRLFDIAKALNVSEAWLLGYDVEMDRTPEQRDNDALTDAVARMQKDKYFRDFVIGLSQLDQTQLQAFVGMLSLFRQQNASPSNKQD